MVAACGGQASTSSGSNASGPTVQAKFAHLQAEHTATNDSARQFAKLVAQYTNNKVQITVYPNAQLGTSSTILQGLESNTIQFYATPDLSAVVPATDVLELPYLFPSAQVASKVLNGQATRDSLWSKFGPKGLTVLGAWSVGYSDILSVNQSVNAPDDLRGMRIRIFDPYVGAKVFSTFHADGINLPSTQVVTALSTHAVDGADDPPSTMYGANWYSSAHYLAVLGMTYVSSPMVVNSAFFNQLSSSEKKAVQKAFQQTLASNMMSAQKYNDQAVQKMQAAGIKITHPAQAPFKSALQPVYPQAQKDFPGVVESLQAAIKSSS